MRTDEQCDRHADHGPHFWGLEEALTSGGDMKWCCGNGPFYDPEADPPPNIKTDWIPHTSHVPLSGPPESHTAKAYFIVELTGTEPPPNWAEDQLIILRKEMAHRFGGVCTSVEPIYLTKTGKMLTPDIVAQLQEEAERGYCTHNDDCPLHGDDHAFDAEVNGDASEAQVTDEDQGLG